MTKTRTNIMMRNKLARQKGYMLLAVMLLVTLLLVALSVELPRISQQIKREKEEELVHRGRDYCTAIKKFYHKNGTYPLSLDQLENTNHMRFLRKRYKDPMTDDGEWKLIHVGEAQINLTPPAGANIGSQGSNNGGSGQSGSGGIQPGAGGPPGSGGSGQPDSGNNPPGKATGQMGTLTVQNIGTGNPNSQVGGPIIGVASKSKKASIKEFNGNSEYDQWLFVYDPRLEQVPGSNGIIIASSTLAAPQDSKPPGPPSTPSTNPSTTPPPTSQ